MMTTGAEEVAGSVDRTFNPDFQTHHPIEQAPGANDDVQAIALQSVARIR